MNCHHSQDRRYIVHYLLGILGSGRPEISGEVCVDDKSRHFALCIYEIIFSTTAHIFEAWPVPQGLVYGSSETREHAQPKVS